MVAGERGRRGTGAWGGVGKRRGWWRKGWGGWGGRGGGLGGKGGMSGSGRGEGGSWLENGKDGS